MHCHLCFKLLRKNGSGIVGKNSRKQFCLLFPSLPKWQQNKNKMSSPKKKKFKKSFVQIIFLHFRIVRHKSAIWPYVEEAIAIYFPPSPFPLGSHTHQVVSSEQRPNSADFGGARSKINFLTHLFPLNTKITWEWSQEQVIPHSTGSKREIR